MFYCISVCSSSKSLLLRQIWYILIPVLEPLDYVDYLSPQASKFYLCFLIWYSNILNDLASWMVEMLSLQYAVSHNLNGIFSNVHFCWVTIDLYLSMLMRLKARLMVDSFHWELSNR